MPFCKHIFFNVRGGKIVRNSTFAISIPTVKSIPISCWVCCKSQKRGKQACNRKFRHQEHRLTSVGDYERLPVFTIEVMNPWDLGGDGKGYFHADDPYDEWFIKLMRK